MRKFSFVLTAMMSASCLFAVDGVVLINQSTVMAAGGFPYQITQPGSYKLTGNLTLPDAKTGGIQVLASNVTLDLNGFGIFGPTVCSGNARGPVTSCAPSGLGYGVYSGPPLQNVTVMNGTVSGTGSDGVYIDNGSIQNVRAYSNGATGLIALNGVISGNVSESNFSVGILAFAATVTANTTNSNGFAGISAFCPSTVVGNTALFNGSNLKFDTTSGTCVAANNTAP